MVFRCVVGDRIEAARSFASRSSPQSSCRRAPGARGASPYLPPESLPDSSATTNVPRLRESRHAAFDRGAVVLDALPRACECGPCRLRAVRRYMKRYMNPYAVTSLENRRRGDLGLPSPSRRTATATRSTRPGAQARAAITSGATYVIRECGGVAYEGEAFPTGSLLSLASSSRSSDRLSRSLARRCATVVRC